MRKSSITRPFCIGTFKSTARKTRLPRKFPASLSKGRVIIEKLTKTQYTKTQTKVQTIQNTNSRKVWILVFCLDFWTLCFVLLYSIGGFEHVDKLLRVQTRVTNQ